MSKVLNLKGLSPDAQKYIKTCKLNRENIKVATLAEKCGFSVKTDGYYEAVKTYNDAVSGSQYAIIEEDSRGVIIHSDDVKLIAVDENQSFDYKRFVAAYLLLSYMLNGQDSELYLESYLDTNLKSELVAYTIDLLVPEEQLKAKLSKGDFDDLMMYFRVPDFALREKVLEYRKKV